jgi:hypothetical protein
MTPNHTNVILNPARQSRYRIKPSVEKGAVMHPYLADLYIQASHEERERQAKQQRLMALTKQARHQRLPQTVFPGSATLIKTVLAVVCRLWAGRSLTRLSDLSITRRQREDPSPS